MNKLIIEARIDAPLFQKLDDHLFPGDGDEHGAVIAAGVVETSRGIRLLAREVFLAKDGVDYVPGTRGTRALTAKFVAEISGYCAEKNLCYLAVHCHGGRDKVCFSADDMASHERGYPALLDITRDNDDCLDCSNSDRSRRARGDRHCLPCRIPFSRS